MHTDGTFATCGSRPQFQGWSSLLVDDRTRYVLTPLLAKNGYLFYRLRNVPKEYKEEDIMLFEERVTREHLLALCSRGLAEVETTVQLRHRDPAVFTSPAGFPQSV